MWVFLFAFRYVGSMLSVWTSFCWLMCYCRLVFHLSVLVEQPFHFHMYCICWLIRAFLSLFFFSNFIFFYAQNDDCMVIYCVLEHVQLRQALCEVVIMGFARGRSRDSTGDTCGRVLTTRRHNIHSVGTHITIPGSTQLKKGSAEPLIPDSSLHQWSLSHCTFTMTQPLD